MKYILLLNLLLVGCASHKIKDLSSSLKYGDSKEKAITVLGQADDRQLNGNKETLQWCETSFGYYHYTQISFVGNVVEKINNYTKPGAPFQSCKDQFDSVK